MHRKESEQARLLTELLGPAFRVREGCPLPLGVSMTAAGLNFAVFSSAATAVSLVLYASGRHEPILELPLEPTLNRTGHVWHLELETRRRDLRYGWRMDRAPMPDGSVYRFDPSVILLDPYARAITGSSVWGARYVREGQPPRTDYARRRSLFVHDQFDWEQIRPPAVPLRDKVIYEMHVRGFTQHPSSAVAEPGTYRGLIEKIPYLKELGVTTVELLPVYEFDENETGRFNPATGEYLRNFWGYSPICFFAPKAAYASGGRNGDQVQEFKTLVREFHRAGLEVFLDVVFNHTAEGEGRPEDPTFSFRGIDNPVYYMLDDTGDYLDYSGCGNTINCNHPVVRDLVLDALRYWVAEMHVDGFRFDLASILGRGEEGEVLANPPLVERIAADPVLAGVTLIAEAWDASGLYQVGTFPAFGRWAEWNDAFRDDVRRFVRGERGFAGRLASRLAGSSDLYARSGRLPSHSINYVTCHDGFTLADLVSYEVKHNEANGENNEDGAKENYSANNGAEGPSADPGINALRLRQMKNMLTILLLSQGVPMILGGDEMGRSQHGNNNAYCQDNEISWIDWRLLETNFELFRFVKGLIRFRAAHPALRRREFFRGRLAGDGRPDVAWHSHLLDDVDWDGQTLAMHLAGEHAPSPDCDIYLAINASSEALPFDLPPLPSTGRWIGIVNTSAPSPNDIHLDGSGFAVDRAQILVRGRSCVVLQSS